MTAPIDPDVAQFDRERAHITYAYVGIDPATFYAGKFAGAASSTNHLRSPSSRFDIELSRVRFVADHLMGMKRVLDLGCGSGPYGATIKQHCRVEELVGVDLDPTCVAEAATSYDRAEMMNLDRELPFPDGYFDAVFSADFFGHIEFRQKSHLVAEVARVTRPGGATVHIVESGYADYLNMDPRDPNDPVRANVWFEGHIGVEPAAIIRKRWAAHFNDVRVENAFIFPFYPLYTYSVDSTFDARFRELIAAFTPEQRLAAQVCLGFVCDAMKQRVREVAPELLEPNEYGAPTDATAAERLANDLVRRPSGLVYLTGRRASR